MTSADDVMESPRDVTRSGRSESIIIKQPIIVDISLQQTKVTTIVITADAFPGRIMPQKSLAAGPLTRTKLGELTPLSETPWLNMRE